MTSSFMPRTGLVLKGFRLTRPFGKGNCSPSWFLSGSVDCSSNERTSAELWVGIEELCNGSTLTLG